MQNISVKIKLSKRNIYYKKVHI